MHNRFTTLLLTVAATFLFGCVKTIALGPALDIDGYKYQNTALDPSVRLGAVVAILTSPYEVHVVCEPELYNAKPGTTSTEAVTLADSEKTSLMLSADFSWKKAVHAAAGAQWSSSYKLDAKFLPRVFDGSNPDDARSNPQCKERMASFAERYAGMLLKYDHVDFQIVRSEVVADYTVTDSSATTMNSDAAAPALQAAGAKLGFKVELNDDKTLNKASKQQTIVFNTEPLATAPLRH